MLEEDLGRLTYKRMEVDGSQLTKGHGVAIDPSEKG